MPIQDYSTDPDLNVQISGINIAEGCPPSGINNAIRQLMADVKEESEAKAEAITAAGEALEAYAEAQAAKDAMQDEAIAAAQSSAEAAGDSAAVSFEVDGLDLVITYGNGTVERVELPAGKSVGDMWWGIDSNSKPANVQVYSGQLLSRSAYPDHWGLVNGQRTVVSESEWQSMVSSQGFCPFYSSGDGSTTYRMPMVNGVHPKFVAALAEAGGYVEAGIPEIWGYLANGGINYYGGAFAQNNAMTGVGQGAQPNYVADFYASRCSSVYRNDCDTVQPPAVNVILGEYVVGTVAKVGEADAESLLAGQTLLDAKVGTLKNGSGFSAAGKAEIIGWFAIDYSAGVNGPESTGVEQSFVAPADGVIFYGLISFARSAQVYLEINGVRVGWAKASASPDIHGIDGCVPVRKNDVVRYFSSYDTISEFSTSKVVFYPYKGV